MTRRYIPTDDYFYPLSTDDAEGASMTDVNTGPPLGPHLDPTPVEKSDPVKVMDAIRLITGYHIGSPDRLDAEDGKMVHYCLTGQGAVEIRRNRIGMSIRKTDKVAGLPDAPCGFVMAIPKIPWHVFAQTVTFFREVIRKIGHGRPLEACVQIFFDPTWRDGVEGAPASPYSIYVPPQRVSGGSVHHQGQDSARDPDGLLIHVADIHSHGSMSAFFSGTDNGDEGVHQLGDRLYGVIGRVMDPIPDMQFRARCGSGFVERLPIEAMIEVPTEEVRIPVRISNILRGNGSMDVRVDPFDGHPIDEKWLDEVKAETYAGSSMSTSVVLRGGSRDRQEHSAAPMSRVGFRPAWDAAVAHMADGEATVTLDAPILVSSSGQQYMDTAHGIVPIELSEGD